MEKLAIDGGVPVRTSPVPGSMHGVAEIAEPEVEAVLNVLRKKRVFRWFGDGQASEADALEAQYRELTGRKYALAVSSGSAALHCALVGVDCGPGDEVIVPAYTFIATAAAVVAAGAVPIIAEVDNSLTLDPEDVERKITPRTKAIIPVSMRGTPPRMEELLAIARRHGLAVVEDVAQANGACYRGRPLGSLGEAGCFSFQHYKIITSGEGGMLVTDDEATFQRARMQHDGAMGFWGEPPAGIPPILGTNYRLSELAAALVLGQYPRLAGLLESFRAIKQRILSQILDLPGIELQEVPDPAGEAGISLIFFCKDGERAKAFSRALSAEGIGNGTIYDNTIPDRHIYRHWSFFMRDDTDPRRLPWKHPRYTGDVRYFPEMCPRSLDYLGRSVAVGIHQRLTEQDADDIARGIRKVALALG